MKPPTLDRHELSEDRHTLTTWWNCDDGVLEQRYWWKEPVTAEILAKALATPPVMAHRVVGEHVILRDLGPVAFGISLGCPTWWFPKVQVRRRSVCFGWLRISCFIGFGRTA